MASHYYGCVDCVSSSFSEVCISYWLTVQKEAVEKAEKQEQLEKEKKEKEEREKQEKAVEHKTPEPPSSSENIEETEVLCCYLVLLSLLTDPMHTCQPLTRLPSSVHL